uniref:potassium channel subfamily K member 2-like isoform X3 n=1 Tax=Styela clava TaxID=7725 RepID=UPI0019397626|nr:potassium channel subfamily K member 2-like isoform X3 [Styela clava]
MNWKILLGLIICYFIYLIVGGIIFMIVEGNYDAQKCEETTHTIENIISKVDMNKSAIPITSLLDLTQEISNAEKYGFIFDFTTMTSTCVNNWHFEASVFFAGTVVTTIGYGHLYPKSHLGRAICIIYALIGIPLFTIMFTGLGGKIAGLVLKLETRINGKATRTWVRKVLLITVISLMYAVLCLLIPSILFVSFEPWSYEDALYYSFISITTIGFGDIVAGTDPSTKYIPIYRIMVYFWILFGMAFMATVMSLISNFFKETGKKGKKRIQNRRNLVPKQKDEVDGEEFETEALDDDNRTKEDENILYIIECS